MKKILTMTFFSIFCAGMLSGCGPDYDTADSTVFAFKDGSIVSTDVEKFDTGTYDKDDLEKYKFECIYPRKGENNVAIFL